MALRPQKQTKSGGEPRRKVIDFPALCFTALSFILLGSTLISITSDGSPSSSTSTSTSTSAVHPGHAPEDAGAGWWTSIPKLRLAGVVMNFSGAGIGLVSAAMVQFGGWQWAGSPISIKTATKSATSGEKQEGLTRLSEKDGSSADASQGEGY